MKRILSLVVMFCIVTVLSACGGTDPGGNGGEPGGDPGGEPGTLFFLDGTWDAETTITESDTEEVGETRSFEQEIKATDTSVTLVDFGDGDLVLSRSGNSVTYSEDEGTYTWTGEFTSAIAFAGTITRTQTFGGDEFATVRSITMTKQ